MQKVVGSSPIIRFQESPVNRGLSSSQGATLRAAWQQNGNARRAAKPLSVCACRTRPLPVHRSAANSAPSVSAPLGLSFPKPRDAVFKSASRGHFGGRSQATAVWLSGTGVPRRVKGVKTPIRRSSVDSAFCVTVFCVLNGGFGRGCASVGCSVAALARRSGLTGFTRARLPETAERRKKPPAARAFAGPGRIARCSSPSPTLRSLLF
jgi:hypothetical protein